MPIFEYRCDQCGHEVEILQKVGEDPVRECPACNQHSLKKLISAAGFRLKGKGWYETDFKTGSKKNVADGGKKSDSATSCGSGGCAGACGAAKDSSAKS